MRRFILKYKIENEFISAEINDLGAELQAFKSKKSNIEYLWQGDSKIWSGQSPILFPIIGQLNQGMFMYNGCEYSLQKHGFARESTFSLMEITHSSAIFSLSSNEATLSVYPFAFELQVKFEVKGNKIAVTHCVVNTDDETIYFSIGAHPGFNCEIGDILEFEKEETLLTERIDENAIIIEERFPLLENAKSLEITKDVFINDALFLTGYQSSSIKLRSPGHSRELRFNFGQAPFLGIWAKPAAPYVCIEPWYGINDSYHTVKDFSKKRGIQRLGVNERFSFTWSAEIFEPEC